MIVDPVSFAAFAFTAGGATFFAPCSYPLLPGYVAYYVGKSGTDGLSPARCARRAAAVGILVSVGFVFVYGGLGAVVFIAGTRALSNIVVLELVVGGLLIVLGAGMVVGKPLPVTVSVRLPERRRSRTAYVGFGIVYATAAAGCTAPVFIGIVGLSLSGGPIRAAAGFGSYAAGMSVPMITITILSAFGREAILERLSRNTHRIARAAGVLLILAGAGQISLFLFRFNGLELVGVG